MACEEEYCEPTSFIQLATNHGWSNWDWQEDVMLGGVTDFTAKHSVKMSCDCPQAAATCMPCTIVRIYKNTGTDQTPVWTQQHTYQSSASREETACGVTDSVVVFDISAFGLGHGHWKVEVQHGKTTYDESGPLCVPMIWAAIMFHITVEMIDSYPTITATEYRGTTDFYE